MIPQFERAERYARAIFNARFKEAMKEGRKFDPVGELASAQRAARFIILRTSGIEATGDIEVGWR